jgi:hypothetical protein
MFEDFRYREERRLNGRGYMEPMREDYEPISASYVETYALLGHLLLLNDVLHLVKIDGSMSLQFSKMDYLLFVTILKADNHAASYEHLFLHVYGCKQTKYLLNDLRKRISCIRLKLAVHGIILGCVRSYGYQIISPQSSSASAGR